MCALHRVNGVWNLLCDVVCAFVSCLCLLCDVVCDDLCACVWLVCDLYVILFCLFDGLCAFVVYVFVCVFVCCL